MIGNISCTHNNGDIGVWFGQWKLTKIEIDGEDDCAYKENIFWDFQSSVIGIKEVINDKIYYGCIGSWEDKGDCIILNFTHTDDDSPESDPRYTPPRDLHFTRDILTLSVLHLSHSHIRLRYIDDKGAAYTYYLKKWG